MRARILTIVVDYDTTTDNAYVCVTESHAVPATDPMYDEYIRILTRAAMSAAETLVDDYSAEIDRLAPGPLDTAVPSSN